MGKLGSWWEGVPRLKEQKQQAQEAEREGWMRCGWGGEKLRRAKFCGPRWRNYSHPEENKKSLEGFKEEGCRVILAF